MRRGAALSVLLFSNSFTVVAIADPCAAGVDRGAALRLSSGPADFGAIPEACPATEASLHGRGQLLVATDEFYGYLQAGVSPRLRRKVSEADWFSLTLPELAYRFAANATVEASQSGLGAGSLGYHHALASLRGLRVAPYVRALFPADFGYRFATRYGIEYGLAAAYKVSSRLELDGGVAFPVYFIVSGDHVLRYLEPAGSVDANIRATRWLSVLAGVGARWRGGRLAGFEALEPRVGVRILPTPSVRFELAGALPLAGVDRTDVLVTLNGAWLFGRR